MKMTDLFRNIALCSITLAVDTFIICAVYFGFIPTNTMFKQVLCSIFLSLIIGVSVVGVLMLTVMTAIVFIEGTEKI